MLTKLLSILLLLSNYLFAQTEQNTLPLKFGSGDSLVFNLRHYSCNDPGSSHQLIFVRNGDCVEVTKQYIDFSSQAPFIPDKLTLSVTDKVNIRYAFVKDTLFKRLKDFKKLDNICFSTNKVLYAVYNNGKAVTIRDKQLRVVPNGKDSKSHCVLEAACESGYLEGLLDYVVTSFKTDIKASCNYKPRVNMPAQGEN